MASDRTQHQTNEEQQRARELSLESNQPPAQIPGYQLQQFIGSGAYGEVWSATDLKTGRPVAVKFYTRRTAAGVQQLRREVEKLLAVSSDARYVVQLFDVGWDAATPYYVMDYIEHGSLEDRLKSGNRIPASEAIGLFEDVARGMVQLHRKGIFHCDLKPGNVLIDQDGNPRVADFGQARLKTDSTPALGTLFYMAPEQADMDAMPDATWDVYGLGALMFSMLTGKPPFYTESIAKQIESTDAIEERLEKYRMSINSAMKPTAHRQVPGVDRMLADIIDRCIAPDPKKRFSSVQNVLFALRQREMAKARRPLMLLGLLLPLLLMGIVTLFGWRAFNQAITRAEIAVMDKAYDSGSFAAEMAAKSAMDQIEVYFRAVQNLANDEQFQQEFERFLADEQLLQLRMALADPEKNSYVDDQGRRVERDPAMTPLRREFISNPLRTPLQKYLKQRMDFQGGQFPVSASWFISDRFGNQVASEFGGQTNYTLGNNYSFRTYFTGVDANHLKTDLETNDVSLVDSSSLDHLGKRTIISQPSVSAAFSSEQSKTWKVAFSTPIITNSGESRVLGIVAVTVDLGKLSKFDREEKNFYTMLVDGRPGQHSGIILEHPLYRELLEVEESEGRLPEDLFNGVFVGDLGRIAKPHQNEGSGGSDTFSWNDPVGQTEIGIQNEYGADSIVASWDVPRQSGPPGKVLRVLAVQDREDLLSDVRSLTSQLSQLALYAMLTLLAIALVMWWFANRMIRESSKQLARGVSMSGDSLKIPDPRSHQSREST